jgi:hypothetical protein
VRLVGRSGKHKNVIVLFPAPLVPLSKRRLKTKKTKYGTNTHLPIFTVATDVRQTCKYFGRNCGCDSNYRRELVSKYMINSKFLLRELFVLKSSPRLYSLHTYIHTYIHACMHTCTYIHTHIHTYIHTFIYTFIHKHRYIRHFSILHGLTALPFNRPTVHTTILLVFSLWASLGRNQIPVRRPVWLWYAASWASS